ncbi:MAG: 16S rRNA (cytosine(1402)-N(4))-methyltransferase RsmH [Acidiferrobacterales bacterium]|nr:16S rRNA (cytosine(1402)-N(4))-methyltransferase RsmH [Acidiferrobacterales bacterium]
MNVNQSGIARRDHVPVLLPQVIDALSVSLNRDGIFVDATYGRGGHSEAILDLLNDTGRLFVLDRDPSAVDEARRKHQRDNRVTVIHANFSEISTELRNLLPQIKVDGILADLGVSSPQLDESHRGFSFSKDGPLDLRMNQTDGVSASVWLSTVSERELSHVLKSLGDERFARRIARKIIESRQAHPIRSTGQLSKLVADCVPATEPHKHPATRTFLAIRMHINRELEELESFLPKCLQLLRQGGRLVLISFQSAEHRIIKRFLKQQSIGSPGPREIPFRQSEFRPTVKVIGKPIGTDRDEVRINRRARSAVMRVAERIGV